MKSSLIAFVKKEFIHISRDKRTMMILLLMPVILIILFGYAITTEIKRVPVAILDQSRDEETQKMISHFAASEYFELYKMIDSENKHVPHRRLGYGIAQYGLRCLFHPHSRNERKYSHLPLGSTLQGQPPTKSLYRHTKVTAELRDR